MDIIESHGVKEPPDNQYIARYFSADKLKLFLKEKKIWFSDINAFKDKHERSIPPSFFNGWTDESKKRYTQYNEAMNKSISAYVSCWTKFDYENYALWKIYDSENDGACIVTTVEKFKRLIARQDMLVCEVNYIDLKDKGSIKVPLIICDNCSIRGLETYKIKPYMYEQEIRSIIYSKEHVKGISVEVDLQSLVEYIYLSPFANEQINLQTENLLTRVFDKSIIRRSIISE